MHWFLDPIQKHYADFEGRVGRQEFWMFVLFNVGLGIVLNVLGLDLISMLVSLALLIPSIALTSRRLHDTGRSGWWQLLNFVPIIGWIIIIVFLAQETTPADNQYGAPAQSKIPSGSVLVASVVTPVVTAPVVTDETVVRDAHVVADKNPE